MEVQAAHGASDLARHVCRTAICLRPSSPSTLLTHEHTNHMGKTSYITQDSPFFQQETESLEELYESKTLHPELEASLTFLSRRDLSS